MSTGQTPPNTETYMNKNETYKLGELSIWQQNLNKSKVAQLDLLHAATPQQFHILAIQEPYVNPHTNLTISNSAWHLVYPQSHHENPARTRAVLMVNRQIPTAAWTEIPFSSQDIAGVVLQSEKGPLQIISVYVDGNNDNTIQKLETHMHKTVRLPGLRILKLPGGRRVLTDESDDITIARHNPNINTIQLKEDLRTVWLGDFNRHHPMWDKERNAHLFTRENLDRAQKLLDLLTMYDMRMALPKDILQWPLRTKHALTMSSVLLLC